MIKAIIIVTLIASFLVGGIMAGILLLIKWIIEGEATVNKRKVKKNGNDKQRGGNTNNK